MTEVIAKLNKNAVSQTEYNNAQTGEQLQKKLIKASSIIAVLIAAMNGGLTLDPSWQIDQLNQVASVIQSIII